MHVFHVKNIYFLKECMSEFRVDLLTILTKFVPLPFQSLVLGGHDTTTVTLTWALSLLLNNPHALKRVQDELDIHVSSGRQSGRIGHENSSLLTSRGQRNSTAIPGLRRSRGDGGLHRGGLPHPRRHALIGARRPRGVEGAARVQAREVP